MKILIRDYLASLKERDELDAILPDLLSELGFTVFSRPQRGTQQRGVDIAAVGIDQDGERKVFLFSVKQGDLTRQDWDGNPQAMRSSLDEILDAYIPNRIPKRYKDLKIVICLAFGGDVKEQVRELLTGYTKKYTNDQISFDEWNGDKISELILSGILREDILPKKLRSNFQKSVAMLDEPEVSFKHFSILLNDLFQLAQKSQKARLQVARQLNICLWILYVWARDIDNLEGPYKASELALLYAWELQKPFIDKKTKNAVSMTRALTQLIDLHVNILNEFLEKKIIPFVDIPHGLSLSMNTQHSLDINLSLFDVLGRIALAGLWLHWIRERTGNQNSESIQKVIMMFAGSGFKMIRNNPTLMLPIADHQRADITLFLQLWLVSGLDTSELIFWLNEMAGRFNFTINTRNHYISSSSDYRELADHPVDRSDEYFQDATAGSTILPLITAWLHALGQADAVDGLIKVAREKLEHCTFQLWRPNVNSEEKMFIGHDLHGKALTELPLTDGGELLINVIAEAVEKDEIFEQLTPIKTGYWIFFLIACHHYRLPVPPHFWINSLLPPEENEQET